MITWSSGVSRWQEKLNWTNDSAACQVILVFGTSRMGSHMSQWTGTEHKEMQRVFVGLLVGAVQPHFLRTARAVIDFIYHARLQVHTTETLNTLQDALKMFHDNKDVFIRQGIRENFNIPKLYQMVHYVESIKS